MDADKVSLVRAAAPALYAALKAILTQTGQKNPGRPTPEQWRAGMDAIRLAEGWADAVHADAQSRYPNIMKRLAE